MPISIKGLIEANRNQINYKNLARWRIVRRKQQKHDSFIRLIMKNLQLPPSKKKNHRQNRYQISINRLSNPKNQKHKTD
jgi:hypothetical protein